MKLFCLLPFYALEFYTNQTRPWSLGKRCHSVHTLELSKGADNCHSHLWQPDPVLGISTSELELNFLWKRFVVTGGRGGYVISSSVLPPLYILCPQGWNLPNHSLPCQPSWKTLVYYCLPKVVRCQLWWGSDPRMIFILSHRDLSAGLWVLMTAVKVSITMVPVQNP